MAFPRSPAGNRARVHGVPRMVVKKVAISSEAYVRAMMLSPQTFDVYGWRPLSS